MSKELIRLRNIRMAFDDEVVLNDLNLYINDKEFLTLLGPSGCGKTTTLRIIGGFTTPVSGDVLFDGVRINDVPPYRRQINTVFQKYALFPHMNVFENVAFGLRMQKRPDPKDPSGKRRVKIPETEIRQRVLEMLEVVSLKGFENRKPDALSGGQQQRVAIARALATKPAILLCDEPTGNLDPAAADGIMQLFASIVARGCCVLMSTHNISNIEQYPAKTLRFHQGRVSEIDLHSVLGI